jgi:hypothetical protein
MTAIKCFSADVRTPSPRKRLVWAFGNLFPFTIAAPQSCSNEMSK